MRHEEKQINQPMTLHDSVLDTLNAKIGTIIYLDGNANDIVLISRVVYNPQHDRFSIFMEDAETLIIHMRDVWGYISRLKKQPNPKQPEIRKAEPIIRTSAYAYTIAPNRKKLMVVPVPEPITIIPEEPQIKPFNRLLPNEAALIEAAETKPKKISKIKKDYYGRRIVNMPRIRLHEFLLSIQFAKINDDIIYEYLKHKSKIKK